MTETLDLARTNIASGVKEDDLKPIKDLLKMADRSPTDVAQTYMHDPAMTNTTALTSAQEICLEGSKNTPAASFSTTALAQGRPHGGGARLSAEAQSRRVAG